MIRSAFVLSAPILLLACAHVAPGGPPDAQTHEDPNCDDGCQRRQAAVRRMEQEDAAIMAVHAGDGARAAQSVIDAENRAEAAKVAAEKRRQEENDHKFEAYGREQGPCVVADDPEHNTCYKAGVLRKTIDEACDILEDIKDAKANIAYQWREGKKYGVIDLEELDNAKGHVEAWEDDLRGMTDTIRGMRGKNFTARDCKASVKHAVR